MTIRAACLRALVMLLGAMPLAGCDIYLQQGRDEALIRVGSERRMLPAAPYADRLLDYALIADQTYTNALYEDHPPASPIGPATYCMERQADGGPCPDARGLTAYAQARLAQWRLIYAEKNFERFGCPPERFGCLGALGGLGVQVWVRRGRVCSEAVIAFRGTDGGSADDWFSNFRWLLRVVPAYDQYTQVQDYTPGLVRMIESERCFAPGRTRIRAVGHSLGGGLAQQAAYRDGAILHVLAFDPSFVTGYYDLPKDLRERNSEGLQIERVYEHGEILAYPRFVLRQLAPLSTCDPEIRTIRFHTVDGNPIARHSLNSIATALLDWSKSDHETGVPADKPFPRPKTDACRAKDSGR